jgi:hypothetical protein
MEIFTFQVLNLAFILKNRQIGKLEFNITLIAMSSLLKLPNILEEGCSLIWLYGNKKMALLTVLLIDFILRSHIILYVLINLLY